MGKIGVVRVSEREGRKFGETGMGADLLKSLGMCGLETKTATALAPTPYQG
uniref:Uncharacterized protein n=1 Tax=Nelumbo nucifera TaxID=4432 RepID=A0A822Y2C6_NELNU|nr:TPA_asm: hypothetical protein HUJ06_025271 [Nelumbo nucifera]